MLGVEETCWQSVREWLIAAGTVGAVLVALFWQPIRERWTRPRLELSFDSESPDAISVDVDLLDGAGRPSGATVPSHWLRLKVSNGRRRRSAHEVRVLVTAVHRLVDDRKERHPLDTVALTWSNLKELTDAVELPPGIDRRVDVACLRWPKGSTAVPAEGSSGCWAELQVIPEPSAGRNHLPAGTYRLELALSARDLDANRYSVELKVGGIWRSDATTWKHFILTDLKRLP